MFLRKLFTKKHQSDISITDLRDHNIELISIHIPKTAGTSFRNILINVYGEKSVLRIDRPLKDDTAFFNDKHLPPKTIPGKVKVIHGHFKILDISQTLKLDGSIPIITWLRDPVERVISNYFYLRKVLHDSIDNSKRHLKVVDRMEKSLLEYALAERNRMSNFLDGIQLKDLFFIGIQDYFSEDLADLAKMLGWEDYSEFKHNTTKEQQSPVDDEIRNEIRKLNEKDIALYYEALELRKLRRNKLKEIK